jgi:hypothetical protein
LICRQHLLAQALMLLDFHGMAHGFGGKWSKRNLNILTLQIQPELGPVGHR